MSELIDKIAKAMFEIDELGDETWEDYQKRPNSGAYHAFARAACEELLRELARQIKD